MSQRKNIEVKTQNRSFSAKNTKWICNFWSSLLRGTSLIVVHAQIPIFWIRLYNFNEICFSYSAKNDIWVNKFLIPKLEKEDPKLKVCYHERDFAAGKSIVENIVDSLDRSRTFNIRIGIVYAFINIYYARSFYNHNRSLSNFNYISLEIEVTLSLM